MEIQDKLLKDKEKILDLYVNQRKSLSFVAKEFGVNRGNLSLFLRENGVQIRHNCPAHRKYELNEYWLDEIDSEEKAYFLGFFFADGHNNQLRNLINIKLAYYDKEILEKFKVLFSSTAPLVYFPARPGKNPQNGKDIFSKEQWGLILYSSHLCDKLAEYGAYHGKSYTVKFPTGLSKNLYRHFIRGLFDGDGTIARVGRTKHPGASMLGSKEILESVSKIVKEELGLQVQVVGRKETDDRIGNINFYSKEKAKSFLSWLYEDATIYLERKYNRYYQYYHNGIMFTTYEEGGW